jgi:hypothetical protein
MDEEPYEQVGSRAENHALEYIGDYRLQTDLFDYIII